MNGPTRVLAVSSGGGHWVQIKRLLPAFAGHQVSFATTDPDGRRDIAPAPFFQLPDANRGTKFRLLMLLTRLAWIIIRTRPDVVITTGAAPGYFAVRIGKFFGARTLFLDSIANAERLSLSAKLAKPHAHVTLTQWPHLAPQEGARYWGGTL